MKPSLLARPATILAALFCLAAPALLPAQDMTPPVVLNRIPRLNVAVGRKTSVVVLDDVFGLSGVADQVVRFSTSLGDMDVVMDSTDAPQNVANFLSYVDFGSYTNSFIHRSVQEEGLAIIQGGGYYVNDGQISSIDTAPPVVNEFAVSNTRGTIAMAKTSDPDSATSEWFFNVQDDSVALDNPLNSGGFTVFGTVIGNGLAVMDALAALQIVNAGSPFDELPVLDSFTGNNVQLSDLAYVNQITRIPLLPTTAGEASLLKVKVAANSNPGLVTAKIVTNKLRLTYVPGSTGLANITLSATDPAGSKVRTTFTVHVN